MKKLLLFALALSLPLAQAARADNDDKKPAEYPAPAAHAAPAHQVQRAPAHVEQHVVRQPIHHAAVHRATANARAAAARRAVANREAAAHHAANRRAAQVHNQAVRDRNAAEQNRAAANNRQLHRENTRVAEHNRSYHHFNRDSFAIARRHVIHEHHNRDWWRNRYHTRFVLFGGGYYYWDSGYWYPAYGYSPIYDTYSYNEPIYGYNNLAPGQVLENVQIALRDQGYYHGPIDGLIGPETRAALAAYQRDHGLAETAAVDEPTLVTLGLA